MVENRVHPIYESGVIAALVEHTHIQSQDVGVVYSAFHAALVRADDEHVVFVDLEIVYAAEEPFDELISRLDSVKAVQRDRVHDAGIIGVKGDDVVDAHAYQFLERDGAIEGFSGSALVLAALIEVGHDHGDPARLAADGSDHSLEVLIVIIRGHMVHEPEHFVGLTVIDYIREEIEVHSPN